MITRADTEAGEFWKTAPSARDQDRLEHEAQMLAVARHPGVVHLLDGDRRGLRFRLARAAPLAAAPPPDPAAYAIHAATTLADLHDLGVVHGALDGTHLLVDEAGQPLFCSFGRATLQPGGAGERVQADVTALARTLLALTPCSGEFAATLRQAEAGRGPRTARQLAGALAPIAGAVPGVRGVRRVRSVRSARTLAAGALVLISLMTLVAVATARASHHATLSGPAARSRRLPRAGQPAPAEPTAVARGCPAVDRGCGPVALNDETITGPGGRYRIGGPGDVVVVGRFRCGQAVPAVLELASGRVWVWAGWALNGAAPLAAEQAGQVPDSFSLRVAPGPGTCDRLEVLRRGGRAVEIRPAGVA